MVIAVATGTQGKSLNNVTVASKEVQNREVESAMEQEARPDISSDNNHLEDYIIANPKPPE